VAIVEFVASALGRAKTVEVSEQRELVDICDDVLAPVPFSCRSASCATCEIEILEGQELLDEPEPLERELLDIIQAPPNHRLACQVKVKPGNGTIRVRAAG
jgi:ferredoxin